MQIAYHLRKSSFRNLAIVNGRIALFADRLCFPVAARQYDWGKGGFGCLVRYNKWREY